MNGLLKKKGIDARNEEGASLVQTPQHPIFQSPLLPFLGSLVSGVALALAFPGFGNSTLIFAAMVPLMYAVNAAPPKRAALLGWLGGLAFFLVSLSWLRNLTGMVEGVGLKTSALLGYVVLAAYCALYFIPPALTVAACTRRWGFGKLRTNVRTMFAVTVVWVASEYLRSFLFTGFPWNPLGVSQYANQGLIQVAEWGGVYLVSACIVWINTALFITCRQYTHGNRLKKYRAHFELMLGLLPLALSAGYGVSTLFNRPGLRETVNVALIQPNIAQDEKWDNEKVHQIRGRLEELTETATRLGGVDLVIWPETALPDFVRDSAESYDLVCRMAAMGSPLLVGTMDFGVSPKTGKVDTYFNSSVLFNTNGLVVAQYNKQHLVPFGEYVPFPSLMHTFTPVDVDCRAGTESTLFPIQGKASFSTLICFEDTVAPLGVKAVRAGARWLVNQSNDGWFDPSAQSEQHLAHAVFRCIENRIPMARCCNTGVTCAIDAYGNIDRHLDPLTEGFTVSAIHPRPVGLAKTFYTRNGDAFAKACLLAAATVAFALRFKGRRNPEER